MRLGDRHPEALLALGALGALSIATPFLARAVGLEVGVSRETEIVDHVVPGAVVLGASVAATLARGPATRVVGLAGACMLAGLFEVVTHVPLIADAAQGRVPWDAALFMSVAGPPMLAISLWLLWLGFRDPSEDPR